MTVIARPGSFATLLVPGLHFGSFQKFRTFNHRLSADGTLVPHLRKCFSLYETHRRHMRSVIILIISLLIYSASFGQIAPTKTELIIIGTIHTGNKNFNHKTLYNVIKRLNPHIILYENSEKHKPVFGLKTATLLKIAKPSIEQLALQTFTKRNRNTLILPYDTTFSRRQYLKNIIVVKQTYYNSLYSSKKSIQDSIIYADFAYKHNIYYSFIDSSTLSRINQKDVIDKSRELHYLEEKLLLPLGKKYISDSLIFTNFFNEIQFWNYRNEHMVNQILNYSKQFAGKRIVILTGLNHKYYLQDKLGDQKENNVKIIEFVNE